MAFEITESERKIKSESEKNTKKKINFDAEITGIVHNINDLNDLLDKIMFLNIPKPILEIISTYAYDYIYKLYDTYVSHIKDKQCFCSYLYKSYAIELVNEICYVADIYTKKIVAQYKITTLTEIKKTQIDLYVGGFYPGDGIIAGFDEDDNKIILRGMSKYKNTNFLEITFCDNYCDFKENTSIKDASQQNKKITLKIN
jgi:hypothetical protein